MNLTLRITFINSRKQSETYKFLEAIFMSNKKWQTCVLCSNVIFSVWYPSAWWWFDLWNCGWFN